MKGKNIFQEKETHKYDDIIHLPTSCLNKTSADGVIRQSAQFRLS